MQQRDRRDHAEHAVEERSGRARRSTRPTMPAIRPWSSACLPSVAETCDCEISSSSDRQRAELEQVREVLGALDREAALDLRAVLAVDAVRVLAAGRCTATEISCCRARSRSAASVGCGSPPAARCRAALGDRARDAWNAFLPVSVKSNVTSAVAAVGSKLCCGFLMSLPDRPGRSWRTQQRSRLRPSGSSTVCSARTTSTPARDLDDLGVRAAPRGQRVQRVLARVGV